MKLLYAFPAYQISLFHLTTIESDLDRHCRWHFLAYPKSRNTKRSSKDKAKGAQRFAHRRCSIFRKTLFTTNVPEQSNYVLIRTKTQRQSTAIVAKLERRTVVGWFYANGPILSINGVRLMSKQIEVFGTLLFNSLALPISPVALMPTGSFPHLLLVTSSLPHRHNEKFPLDFALYSAASASR